MLYIFMGQSCTGKTTVANQLKNRIGTVEMFTGKDYLRMAKNQHEAWKVFLKKLSEAASGSTGETVIYILTEKDLLEEILEIEGVHKVKFTASLETIKIRFAQRMGGQLPPPVAKMLERQHEEWETVKGDISVDTTNDLDLEGIIDLLLSVG